MPSGNSWVASALVPTPSMTVSKTGMIVFLPLRGEFCEAEYWAEDKLEDEGSIDANHDNTGNDAYEHADVGGGGGGGGDGDDSVTNSQQWGDGGMDFEWSFEPCAW